MFRSLPLSPPTEGPGEELTEETLSPCFKACHRRGGRYPRVPPSGASLAMIAFIQKKRVQTENLKLADSSGRFYPSIRPDPSLVLFENCLSFFFFLNVFVLYRKSSNIG